MKTFIIVALIALGAVTTQAQTFTYDHVKDGKLAKVEINTFKEYILSTGESLNVGDTIIYNQPELFQYRYVTTGKVPSENLRGHFGIIKYLYADGIPSMGYKAMAYMKTGVFGVAKRINIEEAVRSGEISIKRK